MANHRITSTITFAALEDLDSQIRDAKVCLGTDDSKIAREAGVSRKMLRYIHDGSYFPCLDKIVAICDALGMNEITIRWR